MLQLSQTQKLQQKLSPQQIQYIKLLQLPVLALEQRIKAELEINPLLDEGLDEEQEEVQDETPEQEEQAEPTESKEEKEERERDEEYDWEDFLHTDDLYGHKAQVDNSPEERRELPQPYIGTLSEHLSEQLVLLDLTEKETAIGEQIIGSIDEDGYLRRDVTAIIDDLLFATGDDATAPEIEHVLRQIQLLDPVGIASRSLRECLLVQLFVLPSEIDGRDDAVRILEGTYEEFTMKHFEQIMRKLSMTESSLRTALELVRSLNPKPGEGHFTGSENYVIPDFTVTQNEGDFVITLNDRNVPPLRINKAYRDMILNKSSSVTDEAKQFIKQKVESARWFINSIQQRRQTMQKVMSAIVELQREFYLHGSGHLRPMILKDVADIIGMDISTVSRVVNGKYVQTDFGTYELKYFFSEGLETDSGEEVSNKQLKAIIKEIIEKEDGRRPLSDDKIAKMLNKEGYNIARRTVTKYREQMMIPVARLRKRL